MMKNRLSALILSVLAILMCFAFAGCGPQDTESTITVKLDKNEVTLTVGQTEKLTAEVSVAGLAVTWASSDSEIVSVDKGEILAKKAGTATITAKVGDSTAACNVTVKDKEVSNEPVFTVEEGYETLAVFDDGTGNPPDLLLGLSAKDSEGNDLRIVVVSGADINLSEMGRHEVTYKATDAKGNFAEFKRDVYVTYYGITLEQLAEKALSGKTAWSYALDGEIRTAEEWSAAVVPGHSTNWNRFEGPVENCIVMHGSDTNGREAITDEVDDETPNTMLWNRVTVPQGSSVFRVFCSNNPYPDYNNLLSRVRLAVYDVAAQTFKVIDGYRDIKAPINEAGDGLDYDRIRTGTYEDFDLSAYEGKEVVLFIQQDAHAELYQSDYYLDIGYLEFQIPTLIAESRDSLVVYSMSFIKDEEEIDYSGLAVDTATSWGLDDTSDYTRWGLRGDIGAKAKWTVKFLNGAEGAVCFADVLGGSIQLIAREPADRRDAGRIVRDAVIMNKVNVGDNSFFEIYVGNDSDEVSVNYRLTFVTEDGKEHRLTPLFEAEGYTPLTDGWATVQKSQWVEGVKLVYDVSAFKNKTVVILIEQDENAEAGDGNCTIWFNKAAFSKEREIKQADYTAYNALKNRVEAADYREGDYTAESWEVYSKALADFRAVKQGLTDEMQATVDKAVKALNNAVAGLVKTAGQVPVPDDTTHGALSETLMGFTTQDWLALPVDVRGIWGTDTAMGETWGLRGDISAKAKWKWYVAGDGSLQFADTAGASFQSIAYECGNDEDGKPLADAMFVNKILVRGDTLKIFVGCDSDDCKVNVRVRLITDDGMVKTLYSSRYIKPEAVSAGNGWYTVAKEQWPYGTELRYDLSAYNGEIVTLLIEQDDAEIENVTSCTMWLNKIEFMIPADYTEYDRLMQEIINANYRAEDYTPASYAYFCEQFEAFRNTRLGLGIEDQHVVDDAVEAMAFAIAGLTERTGPTLERPIAGFTDTAWKVLTTDTATVWGTDDADAGLWGMRGDAAAKAKWSIFGASVDGFGITILDATDATDDDAAKVTDGVLANKVAIPAGMGTFNIWVGTDWSAVGANVRVSVVTEDGTIHTLSTSYTEAGYTALADGWGTVNISQWVYGTKIGYDISAYAGSTVTIVIELDGAGTGRSTLWFVKAELA